MINKDEIFLDKLYPFTLRYIDSNINESGYRKSEAHFRICEQFCVYLTGEDYKQKHGSLRLELHQITAEITDFLESSIGLPSPRGYVRPDIPKSDYSIYAMKLAVKLLERLKQENKEELLELIWDD